MIQKTGQDQTSEGLGCQAKKLGFYYTDNVTSLQGAKQESNTVQWHFRNIIWHWYIGWINRNWDTFPENGQIVNILGFVGHTVSVATTQCCHCSTKTAVDNL